jgi:NAD(P)-dependent dehydrogenase (short-subunit alcohol dehydrogenase family)
VDRLRGRGIIVTGATGIAGASARLFAAEGARVVIVSRTEGHCRELVASITAAGGDASFEVADLTSPLEAGIAVTAACDALGRVDGLFNVAGGSGRRHGDGPLHELTPEGWEWTMRLNATSHVLVSAPVLRAMLAQEPDADGLRGAIVNMGSVLASSPAPRLFATHAYAAAKGAILALTLASAAYYAPRGIRINAVAPALTVSRMSERAQADTETVAFSQRRQPLSGGFLPAEDVAAAALYLLSPEARAVSGQVLTVDGGWTITSTD